MCIFSKCMGVDAIYEVPLLNDNVSFFSRKAFKSDYSIHSYMEMIHEALKYVESLPLGIKVLGSFLYTRNVMQWRATLDGLQSNPDRKSWKCFGHVLKDLRKNIEKYFYILLVFV